MTLDRITKGLKDSYGFVVGDILAGKVKISDVGNAIKTVIENDSLDGKFYFPDPLYDSMIKRYRKAESRKSVSILAKLSLDNNLTLYKYRSFIKSNTRDNVYSRLTIVKAKKAEMELLKDAPRIGKLEKSGGRNGKLHIQGIVALPFGSYDSSCFEALEFTSLEEGITQYLAYLSKPADANLERDPITKKTIQPFELALKGLAEWFIASHRNRRNGLKRNPRTTWVKNIASG